MFCHRNTNTFLVSTVLTSKVLISKALTSKIRASKILVSIIALTLLSACQPAEESKSSTSSDAAKKGHVDTARILNANAEPDQWMTYGRTYDEQRFSPLTEINTSNVSQLGVSWYADYDTNLHQQGTPLYIDGVVYASTAWDKIYALDAKTGEELWKYDPRVKGDWAPKICCNGFVSRGIAAYNDKIYIGTLDGYLVAIDRKTGKEVWRTLTIDPTKQYSITMAPRAANGKIFVGNSGAEFGVRGYLSAYDAETGELSWRFYTVPGNPADGFENEAMKRAADTWSGEWWTFGGGGTVWDAVIYDEVNNTVIFGTGNGTPWNASARGPEKGDNLYVASIVAVNADTGEYAWHYQAAPGDTWDYDNVSPMMLVNLDWEGQQRRVVLQPSKNGFMYVLDAVSGKLLKADPFTALNWADGVDLQTGRPNVRPEALYTDTGEVFNLAPGVQGAHGWHANAFHPDTGLIYIATQEAYFPMKADPNFKINEVGANIGLDFGANFSYYQQNPEAPRGFVGFLQAWDPVKGESVWKGEQNQGPTGGALATAGGLIFQGSGSNNSLRAYDAKSGEKVWEMDAQTQVLAPPITYSVDGKQYIAVTVGGAGASSYYAPNYSRLLVFGLGGNVQLPPTTTFAPPPLNPPELLASAEEVAAGAERYSQFCAVCHGPGGNIRGANFPDLLTSPFLHSQEGFDSVVLQGVRSENGMASFAANLQPQDAANVRSYLIAQAISRKNSQPPTMQPPPEVEKDIHEELEDR